MKKKISIVVLIVIILLFYKCILTIRNKPKDVSYSISIKLQNIIENSKSDTISFKFSDIINSDCNQVLILYPYTNIERAEKELNIKLPEIKKTGIKSFDRFSVLCMFNDSILKEYATINNNVLYLSYFDYYYFKFIPKETEFSIIKVKNWNILANP